MTDLAAKIEAFLLEAKGWVSTETLCSTFGINERALRAVGDKPGLCTEFAISGNQGFRHVKFATDAEFNRFYGRGRNHGIRQLIRLRKLKRRRASLLAKPQPPRTRDGQFLLITP
jgi:hypothetical protein